MNIIPLFPTAVGVFELGRNPTKEEIDFVTSLDKRPNVHNKTSMNNYILKEEPMKAFRDFIVAKVEEYFRGVLTPESDAEIYITQSWVNYTSKGESHHKHFHPNSFLSGVFYVRADPDKDKIVFHNDDNNGLVIRSASLNTFNAPSWWLPTGTGILYIFPSHLLHSVETVDHEEERISLSFNTFLRGSLGNNMGLTELIL